MLPLLLMHALHSAAVLPQAEADAALSQAAAMQLSTSPATSAARRLSPHSMPYQPIFAHGWANAHVKLDC